jgi:hypothetical protein
MAGPPLHSSIEIAMTHKLDIAFWNYDRIRLLADRTVKIEGIDASFHSAPIVPGLLDT